VDSWKHRRRTAGIKVQTAALDAVFAIKVIPQALHVEVYR